MTDYQPGCNGELPVANTPVLTKTVMRYRRGGIWALAEDIAEDGKWVLYEDIKHLLTPAEPSPPPHEHLWSGTSPDAFCIGCGVAQNRTAEPT